MKEEINKGLNNNNIKQHLLNNQVDVSNNNNFNTLLKEFDKVTKSSKKNMENLHISKGKYNNSVKLHQKSYIYNNKDTKEKKYSNKQETIGNAAKVLIELQEKDKLLKKLIKKINDRIHKEKTEKKKYNPGFFGIGKSNNRKKFEELQKKAERLLLEATQLKKLIDSKIINAKNQVLLNHKKGSKLAAAARVAGAASLTGAVVIAAPLAAAALPAVPSLL